MSKSSLSIATMALMLAMSGSALLGGTALASAPSTAGANMSQHGIVPSACQTFNYDFGTHTFTSVPTSCTTSSTSSTNTNPGTQNNNCRNYSYVSPSSGQGSVGSATGATCNTSATGTRGASY
jgi:hypothetical protein